MSPVTSRIHYSSHRSTHSLSPSHLLSVLLIQVTSALGLGESQQLGAQIGWTEARELVLAHAALDQSTAFQLLGTTQFRLVLVEHADATSEKCRGLHAWDHCPCSTPGAPLLFNNTLCWRAEGTGLRLIDEASVGNSTAELCATGTSEGLLPIFKSRLSLLTDKLMPWREKMFGGHLWQLPSSSVHQILERMMPMDPPACAAEVDQWDWVRGLTLSSNLRSVGTEQLVVTTVELSLKVRRLKQYLFTDRV